MLRCYDKTSTTFGVMSAEQLLSIIGSQLALQTTTALRWPDAKRGLPRGIVRKYTPQVRRRWLGKLHIVACPLRLPPDPRLSRPV